MAAFTLSIETGFFEKYARFYGDIQRHVAYSKIEAITGTSSRFLKEHGIL